MRNDAGPADRRAVGRLRHRVGAYVRRVSLARVAFGLVSGSRAPAGPELHRPRADGGEVGVRVASSLTHAPHAIAYVDAGPVGQPDGFDTHVRRLDVVDLYTVHLLKYYFPSLKSLPLK